MSQPPDNNLVGGDRALLSLKKKELWGILETVLDAIAILDDRGRYLYVNSLTCELLGAEKQRILGRYISEFGRSELNFPAVCQELQQSVKVRGQWQLLHPDGEDRVVEYAVTANFRPHRHLLVMRDITEIYQAQTRIQELTRQLTQAQIKLQEAAIAPANSTISSENRWGEGSRGGAPMPAPGEERVSVIHNEPPVPVEPSKEGNILEQIASRIPGIIYQFKMLPDGSCSFPYVNGSTQEIYGISREAAQQDVTGFFKHIHHEDISRVNQSILDSATHLTPWYCEYRLCFPDGRLLWLRGNSTPQLEPDGSIVWHGCVLDITESKATEIALRNSEAKFRSIIENLNDTVYIITPDGTFNYVSSQFKNITGYELADLLDRSFAQFVHPEDLQVCEAALQRTLRGEKLRDIEYRVLHQDGNYYWHSSNLSALESDGKEVVSCLGISRYIHDRKQAEIELAGSQAELMALFNAIKDVIIVLNAEGRLLKIAQSSAPLLYRPSAEVLGKTIHEIFPQDMADVFLKTIHEAIEDRALTRLEYSLPIGDRLVCFDASVSPMSDDLVVWVARDITDSKHQEQALRLIVEGTAAKTGADFFKSCVQYMAQVLEVRYALIAEVIDSENSIAKTL
ncbi:MAG: PAS domain S-box protein, partial [Microcoleus sp.]